MGHRRQTDKDLLNLEKKLKRKYSATWKEIRRPIEEYLESFAKRDEKMQKDLKNGKVRLPKGQSAEAYYKAWRLKELTQTEEWADICNEAAKRLTETDAECRALVAEEQKKTYEQNYNGTAYNIATIAGAAYSGYVWLQKQSTSVSPAVKTYTVKARQFPTAKARAVKVTVPRNNVEFKIMGSTGTPHYFDPTIDIPRDYKWNRQRMQQMLESGVMQGKATPKIAKDFQATMGQNQAAAVRIARTGVTSAQGCATLDAMYKAREMGLDVKKKWKSTHDGRVRDSHAHIDSETRELEDTFSNGLQYPGDSSGHPSEVYNCRCTMETVYPSDGLRNQKVESGRFTGTYDEWNESNKTLENLLEKGIIKTRDGVTFGDRIKKGLG